MNLNINQCIRSGLFLKGEFQELRWHAISLPSKVESKQSDDRFYSLRAVVLVHTDCRTPRQEVRERPMPAQESFDILGALSPTSSFARSLSCLRRSLPDCTKSVSVCSGICLWMSAATYRILRNHINKDHAPLQMFIPRHLPLHPLRHILL